jgi:hypothetical protein
MEKVWVGKKLVWKWFGNGLEMVMANGFNKSRNGKTTKTAKMTTNGDKISSTTLNSLIFHPIW